MNSANQTAPTNRQRRHGGRRAPSRPRPEIGRHQRLFGVCRHPDRAAIEQAFLDWRSPAQIAIAYGLSDRATVYRHARVCRLMANANSLPALQSPKLCA